MRGYDENYSVANHIWDSLVQNNLENILEQANNEQEPLTNLHQYW